MNNNIKITLDLDGRMAAEAIDNLEVRLNKLIKEITDPVRLNIEPPSIETMNTLGNIPFLLKELKYPAEVINPDKGIIPGGEKKADLKLIENEYVNHQTKLTAIERKYSSARVNISADENRRKNENIEIMLSSAAGIFGRDALFYKTISIAEATMSAYNAANAALLPPPIGAGPILGEIQAGIVLMNSLKRVEKIAAAQIPGYAKGGIVVGENGPEVIENMQDYSAGRAELIQKTISAMQTGLNDNAGFSPQIANEIKNLRADLNKILERPSVAFLDDKEAKKIYYQGVYFARKTR